MITNTTAKSTYVIADGVNTYAIGFQYDYNPDGTPQIQLYLNNHPESPLVYGTDYTLSGDELSVVLLDNYSVGDKLYILRSIPMVQLSDYVIGRIDPEQIERDFDESVMRDQQLQAEIDTLSELPIDHEQRITAIEEKIPDEASPSNQLADKAYVGTQISNHTSRTDNPHEVTAAQVGLGNCDNTADADKPISTATQSALDLKANSADLSTVATSGDYDDLLNKPTLGTMAAEDTSDYTPSSSLSTVATSGSYNDLSDTPSIPSVINDLSDVATASVQDGEFLKYDGVAGKWKNVASTATVGFDGITGDPYDNTNLSNALNSKAPATAIDTLLASLYPVGSIYIGTQNTCPLTTLITGSTWTLVSNGKALWTGDGTNGNTTIAAGLPNITGSFKATAVTQYGSPRGHITETTGAFSGVSGSNANTDGGDGGTNTFGTVTLNASTSSSVYGNSTTVQPPAYVVNVWRRDA